jgi:deoxyadenosine/deoxycytidine kinase
MFFKSKFINACWRPIPEHFVHQIGLELLNFLITIIFSILYQKLSISDFFDICFVNFILLILSQFCQFLKRFFADISELEIVYLLNHKSCALKRVAHDRILTRQIVEDLVVTHELAFASKEKRKAIFYFVTDLTAKSVVKTLLNVRF